MSQNRFRDEKNKFSGRNKENGFRYIRLSNYCLPPGGRPVAALGDDKANLVLSTRWQKLLGDLVDYEFYIFPCLSLPFGYLISYFEISKKQMYSRNLKKMLRVNGRYHPHF